MHGCLKLVISAHPGGCMKIAINVDPLKCGTWVLIQEYNIGACPEH